MSQAQAAAPWRKRSPSGAHAKGEGRGRHKPALSRKEASAWRWSRVGLGAAHEGSRSERQAEGGGRWSRALKAARLRRFL